MGYSLQAAAILSDAYHVEAKVVDVHTLKPFDTDTVEQAKDYSLFVTAEEHNTIGYCRLYLIQGRFSSHIEVGCT